MFGIFATYGSCNWKTCIDFPIRSRPASRIFTATQVGHRRDQQVRKLTKTKFYGASQFVLIQVLFNYILQFQYRLQTARSGGGGGGKVFPPPPTRVCSVAASHVVLRMLEQILAQQSRYSHAQRDIIWKTRVIAPWREGPGETRIRCLIIERVCGQVCCCVCGWAGVLVCVASEHWKNVRQLKNNQ